MPKSLSFSHLKSVRVVLVCRASARALAPSLEMLLLTERLWKIVKGGKRRVARIRKDRGSARLGKGDHIQPFHWCITLERKLEEERRILGRKDKELRRLNHQARSSLFPASFRGFLPHQVCKGGVVAQSISEGLGSFIGDVFCTKAAGRNDERRKTRG